MKTNGCLKSVENERDKTVPTEKFDAPALLKTDDLTDGCPAGST